MHIIVTGNPVNGFTYHGLFDNEEAAIRFAEDNIDSGDWWLAHLELHSLPEEAVSSKPPITQYEWRPYPISHFILPTTSST